MEEKEEKRRAEEKERQREAHPTCPPPLRMLSEICSLTGWCRERERGEERERKRGKEG